MVAPGVAATPRRATGPAPGPHAAAAPRPGARARHRPLRARRHRGAVDDPGAAPVWSPSRRMDGRPDPAAELPHGTLTLVFTDIEGSTRLLARLGEGYGELLGDHRRLLRAACAAHGGRELGTEGDSCFVAFARARDAVAAVSEAQRALAAHPWPGGAAVRVRIGIHTSEPAAGPESLIGLGVHRAARICAAAHGGQVLL